MENTSFEGGNHEQTISFVAASSTIRLNNNGVQVVSKNSKMAGWKKAVAIVIGAVVISCCLVGIMLLIQKSNKVEWQFKIRELVHDIKGLKNSISNLESGGNTGGRNVHPTAGRRLIKEKHITTKRRQKHKSRLAKSHTNRPWLNMTLPPTIIPDDYDLALTVDMDTNRYKGDVNIKVSVANNTRVVLLHMKGLRMHNVTLASLTNASDTMTVWDKFYYHTNEFYVIQTTEPLKKDNSYIINIIFSGKMNTDLNGFYTSNDINKTKMAGTSFKPIRARQAFPCFDEPSFKATFTLTLTHDVKYKALSNMKPIQASTVENVATTKFEKTFRMSTYLLCWVLTEYSSVERLTAWPNPYFNDVTYTLSVGSKLLKFYEHYFNMTFPLPKLDLVLLPHLKHVAISNPGIITFRAESFSLTKHDSAETARKQEIVSAIAHALVHQWFGSSVTLEFWEDLWLSEGIASVVGAIGGNYFLFFNFFPLFVDCVSF